MIERVGLCKRFTDEKVILVIRTRVRLAVIVTGGLRNVLVAVKRFVIIDYFFALYPFVEPVIRYARQLALVSYKIPVCSGHGIMRNLAPVVDRL